MTHINQRRDLAATWNSVNPILQLGEVGWEIDTGKAKLGDGVTPWIELFYVIGEGYSTPNPDRRYFRGDWQNPEETLLWSTSFSSSDDIDCFGSPQISPSGLTLDTYSFVGIAETPATNRPVGFSGAVRMRATYGSGFTGRVGGVPFLDSGRLPEGSVATQVKAWLSCSTPAADVQQGLFRSIAAGNSVAVATAASWSELTLTNLSSEGDFFWGTQKNASGSSGNFFMYLTGLRVYGVQDATQIYQRDDTVTHDGFYWRSLYDDNTEEPGTGPMWLQIESID